MSWQFLATYSSEHCKESLDGLKYGMTLSEFIEYQNFIDIQTAYDLAIHKDHEREMRAQQKR